VADSVQQSHESLQEKMPGLRYEVLHLVIVNDVLLNRLEVTTYQILHVYCSDG
jgi:hypothetical protein